jgi:hypothetical protein
MYFPSFLDKFSRGEEIVKAGGGVRCTTSNGTWLLQPRDSSHVIRWAAHSDGRKCTDLIYVAPITANCADDVSPWSHRPRIAQYLSVAGR